MTHICVSKLRHHWKELCRQTIIWTTASLLSTEPLGNVSDILIKIQQFLYTLIKSKFLLQNWWHFVWVSICYYYMSYQYTCLLFYFLCLVSIAYQVLVLRQHDCPIGNDNDDARLPYFYIHYCAPWNQRMLPESALTLTLPFTHMLIIIFATCGTHFNENFPIFKTGSPT